MDENTKKLVEAWNEVDERCPDCGGIESGCHEMGCLSEEWTDEDTKEYQERVKNGNTDKMQTE